MSEYSPIEQLHAGFLASILPISLIIMITTIGAIIIAYSLMIIHN